MSKPTAFYIIPATLVVAVLALFIILVTGFPVTDSTGYGCPYCSAHLSRLQVLGVSTRETVIQTNLSRYWMKHVDPHHTHTWVKLCGNHNLGFGAHYDCSGWAHERWALKDEVALTVLKALPSASTRKQFMTDLWGAGISKPKTERNRTFLLIHDLKSAYDENPNRTDWRKLLNRHGYN